MEGVSDGRDKRMTDIERLAGSRTFEGNLLKLAEECGELTQAISKYYEASTLANRQHIIEEIADVLICMETVKAALDITEAEITDMRYHKMIRNMQRIGG